jgi:EKC/KEOPS complex subunit CGI121/TPRKB
MMAESGSLVAYITFHSLRFSMDMADLIQIGEAFRKFGLGDSTKDIVAIKILTAGSEDQAKNVQDVEKHLRDSVNGEQVVFDDEQLGQCTDLAKVMKTYKTGDTWKQSKPDKQRGKGVNGTALSKEDLQELEALVLGMMAIKGS